MAELKDGWEKSEFAGSDWKPAVELGDAGLAPWKMAKNFAQAEASLRAKVQVRAALVNADPLMVSLGRPNREVVITSRPTAATTLQALELTNGETLSKLLQQATAKLIVSKPGFVARDLVTQLFQQALGRKPTVAEFTLSLALVGEPANKEGVEDLLWSLAMLPEFQLIY